jgi:aerobic-type carbon monoxide dehydrogenase small subunit (CoxS/CutS family)
MNYTITVNRERRTVDVPERMPLLWVLRDTWGSRDEIRLRNRAVRCVYGAARRPSGRSCQTQISAVGTRAVLTIESLPQDASHPLQKAWMDLDVPQCGYCQAARSWPLRPADARPRIRPTRKSTPR